MVATSSLSFCDVLLVPFPFTDQSGAKKRPAVIVSSSRYNANRRDIVIMAITIGYNDHLLSARRYSQISRPLGSSRLPCSNPYSLPLSKGLSSARWVCCRPQTLKRCAKWWSMCSGEGLSRRLLDSKRAGHQ